MEGPPGDRGRAAEADRRVESGRRKAGSVERTRGNGRPTSERGGATRPERSGPGIADRSDGANRSSDERERCTTRGIQCCGSENCHCQGQRENVSKRTVHDEVVQRADQKRRAFLLQRRYPVARRAFLWRARG